MYFPYLRGKKEELLALQELIGEGLLSTKIVPIIEPVTLSSTFINTLNLFIENQKEIIIIRNPLVGNFHDDMSINLIDEDLEPKEKVKIEKIIENQKRYNILMSSEYIHHAFIYSDEIEEGITEFTNDNTLINYSIILNSEGDYISFSEKFSGNFKKNIRYCFIPILEYKENDDKAVIYRDRFNRRTSNSEYVKPPLDEFFSRDHINFNEYSYKGFSDFSFIGSRYESGFAPYAIAIHIIYFDEETNIIRIRHFTSDTNHTNRNPALKFSEAATKLLEWSKEHTELKTLGLEKILTNLNDVNYPGLGSLKRFSLMHHLELISQYLEE